MNETIAALATPPGESALALIRVSGNLIQEIIASALPAPGQAPPPPRAARVGHYRLVDGSVLDQVVWIHYPAPRSYTGEDMLELMPHGSPFITQRLLEDLGARGCRLAEPGEFTRLAFLNGKLDLAQAEAIVDVIRARSDQALAVAQRQLGGALGRHVGSLVEALLRVTAHLEAYIDFPEEDLPAEDVGGPVRELVALREQIDQLIATEHYRDRLQDGIRVVLIGEPNAGKSSILNALIEEDRAIVSEEAGTTRDFIEVRTSFGGHLVRLFDTAGLRESDSRVERAGVERTLRVAGQADVLLFVHDASLPFPSPDGPLADLLRRKPVLWLLNKADLVENLPVLPAPFADAVPTALSATRGDGFAALRERLREQLDEGFAVPADADVAISARHASALQEAKVSLLAAVDTLRRGETPELAATDLHVAIEAMGRIVGRIDNERVLDELFGSFCIGK
ncbi:MAG: tRNA uridine-5-carboxymethylaminomethyl(34) synthesis GTPase MnmE [Verrucomicrobiota bacterium]